MTRFALLALASFAGVSAFGCSSSSSDSTSTAGDDGADDLTEATAAKIAFERNRETFDGGLFEGESVSFTYDVSRMQNCTRGDGDPHHGPAYDYTLFYKWRGAPNDSFQSKLVANTNGSATIALTAPFHATGLEIYVEHTNPRGCSQYDSANGANFVYPVAKARIPSIHFEKDGSLSHDGTLKAGSPILVDYASMRLENCNSSGRKLKMFGRADGQDLPAQDLVEASAYERTIGRLTPPAGAHHLELWFETIDFHACTQWDSKNGQNFGFDLAP